MEEQILKAADRWIDSHREELIEDIKTLARIRSVSDRESAVKPYGEGCRKVLDAFLAMGRGYGFQTENYDYHCGAVCLDGRGPGDSIGLWGHLDVVPEGDNWAFTAPYDPVYREGYLIGRGVSDNKGSAVADLYLLRCFSELGIPLPMGLRAYGGCDEEKGMQDLGYYTAHYEAPAFNIVTDAGFPVCHGEKGILEGDLCSPVLGEDRTVLAFTGGRASNMVPDAASVTLKPSPALADLLENLPPELSAEEKEGTVVLTARGLSKHTAFPFGGVNAIYLLTGFLAGKGVLSPAEEAAFALFNSANGDCEGAGLGISVSDEVSGALTCVGSMAAIKDGELCLSFNIRYPVTADSKKIIAGLSSAAQARGCSLKRVDDNRPNYFPKDHPAVKALTDAFNACQGTDKEPYVMGGGTYARKLPRAVAFGMGLPGPEVPASLSLPGHGGGHEPDELLHVDTLLAGMKIMARSLAALMELGPSVLKG